MEGVIQWHLTTIHNGHYIYSILVYDVCDKNIKCTFRPILNIE